MNMQSIPYFSVIIAGAGLTGLAMGNLLGMLGVDVLILERNAGLSDSPKATTIDDEGLRICQAMGLIHPVLEHMLLDVHAHYLSGGRTLAKVAPGSRRNGYPLISTLHQPAFEAILLRGLKRFACVTLQFGHTVESFEQAQESVIVSVRTPGGSLKQLECAYLLGCDGGKSTIRRVLDIPMRGSTFAQKWLVIDSIHDEDPSTVVKFFCNPARPAVTVPAPQNARRWEFMLLPGEREEDILQEERVQALIQQVGGSPHPQIIRRVIYTFHAMLAATFSKGRVFLLGDAAHLMPPFGGQGMNSGLRDAHNLSWKLHLVLQGLAGPGLLDTYTQECHAHVLQMIRFSKLLGNAIMPTSKSMAYSRDALLYILNAVPAIREYLSEARVKPQPRYKKGFMLPGGSKENRRLAGLMLPQPEITTAGGRTVLLDEVLGPGFALLRVHDDAQEAFAPVKAGIWQRLGVRCVCIQHYEAGAGFPLNRPDLFVLVRPDRYIFGVFSAREAADFAAAFEKMLAQGRGL